MLQEYTYLRHGHTPDVVTFSGEQSYYLATDERGTPRTMLNTSYGYYAYYYYIYTDQNSQIVEWDEWGNRLSDTNPGLQPFGFGGSLYDADLNLHHLGAREYDPTVGRWLQLLLSPLKKDSMSVPIATSIR